MTDGWSTRGSHYASSEVHKRGPSLAKLLALARPARDDICLDIGTGAGHTAAALSAYTAHVIGLDVSQGMLHSAHDLYGELENLEFVLAPAHATGLEAGSFDLITARHTLHHHPDVVATLAEANRLLKPGGRMVIVDEVTPDAQVDAWYDLLERTRDPTHVRAYRVSEWHRFVTEAGLEWVVGDSHTVYDLDVASWIARMSPDRAAEAAVYSVFSTADAHTREVFGITYEEARAVRFQMPMALILAVKPVSPDDDVDIT